LSSGKRDFSTGIAWMAESRMYRFLVLLTLATSLALIVTSSLMHIGNVGIGSADWPASYGLIGNHGASPGISADTASDILPTPIIDRAHRGIASFLQLLIIAVFIMAFRQRKRSELSVSAPLMALGLSLFLAFLGVWFGSPLRYPAVVILNLSGGIGLLALYWWMTLDIYAFSKKGSRRATKIRGTAIVALLVLILEILLGAWTDAYYAATACMTLPDCDGAWLPGLKLWQGLSMLGNLDVDGHGKVIIDQAVARDIHISHRIGALITFIVLIWLAIKAWLAGAACRISAAFLLLLLLVQTALGIATAMGGLIMMVVVCHSILSALLIVCILTLIHQSSTGRRLAH
jgi:cytochrome c oxidase assembly protein subunit 15